MTDIPIIFSAPMVMALLAGRKTMTRRLAWRSVPDLEVLIGKKVDGYRIVRDENDGSVVTVDAPSFWQRVKPGDRLWVRETMTKFQSHGAPFATCHYPADETGVAGRGDVARDFSGRAAWQWERCSLSSIHMPRWASRLTLVITATKTERLCAISEADATAEGWVRHPELSSDPEVHRDAARDWFSDLWEDLHGVQSWKDNPEVVALTFTVHRQNIDALEAAA